MDDPQSTSQPLRLTGPPEQLYQAYYRPVVDYLSSAIESDAAESVEVDGIEFKVVHDPNLDIFVGLAGAILATEGADLEIVRRAVGQIAAVKADAARQRGPSVLDSEGREWSIGSDGVIVRLGQRWQ